ncbi:MAG: hypothetical protein ACE5DM_04330 [Candidatus Nanoarchaeia archaeon]
MKCEICKQKIRELFLRKLVGGYVKDKKGRKHSVCNDCQKKYPKKENLLAKL